jgi:hypothetical protein
MQVVLRKGRNSLKACPKILNGLNGRKATHVLRIRIFSGPWRPDAVGHERHNKLKAGDRPLVSGLSPNGVQRKKSGRREKRPSAHESSGRRSRHTRSGTRLRSVVSRASCDTRRHMHPRTQAHNLRIRTCVRITCWECVSQPSGNKSGEIRRAAVQRDGSARIHVWSEFLSVPASRRCKVVRGHMPRLSHCIA